MRLDHEVERCAKSVNCSELIQEVDPFLCELVQSVILVSDFFYDTK
jgi:hypothetical protein